MAKPRPIPQARTLEIQEDISSWISTKNAFEFIMTEHVMSLKHAEGFGAVPLEERIRGLYPRLKPAVDAERDAIRRSTPTFCSTDYSMMALAMAASAPANTITAADAAAPTGLLVFEEPIDIDATEGQPPIRQARALSWHLFDTGEHVWLITRFWSEDKNSASHMKIPGRLALYPGWITHAGVSANPDNGVVRLLQAHFALLRSPLTADEPAARDPKITPRTKRSLGDNLRRVYLRHPEYARYEADEATAAREGRTPMRAHWVRGHWRNQHYSTLNENRWIWIDGFIKGNPEHGTVSTLKVAVARATRAEIRELAGAAA
ncbi:hypothetical protein GCM10023063_18550 [Arthrobacter methylotrophus]|uniref:Uncharacterized protein n=1 Tax=Arthrobacter methylotrophus TaxID=121291 RepID=A0ABV5URH7_9MICC